MRIIGSIPHPTLKITVFKMDNRLSIKFEAGMYEQTYKFRESTDLQDFAGAQRLVDEPFLRFVLEEFERMHRAKNEAVNRFLPQAQAEFEEII